MKTVIFLHHPLLNDTFAYFPLEKWDRMGNRLCYGNDGIGACSQEYAAECEDATPAQYNDIEQALSIDGYKLKILLKNDLIKSK